MEKSNQQYYTLNLGHIEIKHSRQSIYRVTKKIFFFNFTINYFLKEFFFSFSFKHWNRLTRLQKTLIFISLVLFSVYFFSHIQFHTKSLKNIPQHHEHQSIEKNDKLINYNLKEFEINNQVI